MAAKKAVMVIGSPRLEKSTSKRLGDRLVAGLEARGIAVETHFTHKAIESEARAEALFAAADAADIVFFAFPLYVDHLPAPVVWACEAIAARRRGRPVGIRRPLLAALIQCGFPELHQNKPAVDVMRRFAGEAGFAWAGGLAMGMGGAANRPLPAKPSGMLRNMVSALDAAAADLAEGRPIAPETIVRAGQKVMPYRLYSLAANFGFRLQVRKNARKLGKKIDACDRPFAD
jgi:NAD(P)H-dependent FMN reductase